MKIDEVTALIQTLRGEGGCPWDKKQTAGNMAMYLVEEAYELLEAVESGNAESVCEELGDVLFQVLFIACLFQEKGLFDIHDVAEKNRQKMIRRHPHVFGNEAAENADQVKRLWREIKQQESGKSPHSILDAIPKKLPALMRAYRVSERAAGCGFDWADIQGVMGKADEEWEEFRQELASDPDDKNKKKRLALELGDILFTLTNVARFARIHPETALSQSIRKFENRFRHMEAKLAVQGSRIEQTSAMELERLWEAAKQQVG